MPDSLPMHIQHAPPIIEPFHVTRPPVLVEQLASEAMHFNAFALALFSFAVVQTAWVGLVARPAESNHKAGHQVAPCPSAQPVQGRLVLPHPGPDDGRLVEQHVRVPSAE